MSPASRKRSRSKPARSTAPQPPTPDAIVAATVRDACAELERLGDPLQAELYVSELLGAWWGLFMVDADPEVVFGEAVVAAAAKKRRAGALALLRCVARLGTPRQREQAAAGAERLAARGVSEPPWGDVLGAERVTTVFGYGDVYGDQTSVLIGVERPGSEHGVVVLVDHTLGGIAKDAFVTPAPAETLTDIRGIAGPTVWQRELAPDEAAALLHPAFAASDAAVDPPVNDDFRAFRAIAAARVRLLGEPPAVTAPQSVGTAERRAIVADFLGSDAARGLPDEAREVAQQLVEFGCVVDNGQPLRVSPAKIERFLAEWAPGFAPDVEAALVPTVRAWSGWAAQRNGLPQEAVAELGSAVEEMLAAVEDGTFDVVASPGDELVETYLAGVDLDEADPESLPELVARRHFAMPYFGTRIGDQDFPHLDASDPDQRALLIEGEHPEYHEALADPGSPEVDGVNPRLHVAVHQIVANQLWDDDPPEAWQAAKHLLADGMDRHDVLHALGEVVTRHVYGGLTGGDVDPDAYVADLVALTSSPGPGAGRA